MHYGYVIITVTFCALLAAAGLRAAPSVLMLPLQFAFGWDRATVAAVAGVSVFLSGLVGPFCASLMQRFGIRAVMITGLSLMAAGSLLSLRMSHPWQYMLTWGVVAGMGSGAIASVLSATVVNRWFQARQGLMMGLLTGSTATGSLVVLPMMAQFAQAGAWRPIVLMVGLTLLALVPVAFFLIKERPSDLGLLPYGAIEPPPTKPTRSMSPGLALEVLTSAGRAPHFWLLFFAFYVCGFTTNGLVGGHLIAYCGDRGLEQVQSAGLLSWMGVFDLIGVSASGWLTDRFDPRKLLFIYFGLRGLALLAFPYIALDGPGLAAFTVVFGLDWIATVPPTLKLINTRFGFEDGPIVYGWIFMGHQFGAATAAAGAGLIRQAVGDYAPAFLISGVLALGVSSLMLWLSARPSPLRIGQP